VVPRQAVEDCSGGLWYSAPSPLVLFPGALAAPIPSSERGAPAGAPARGDLEEARRVNRPVSLAHAARLYRKSAHTLRAAIQSGDLRAQRVGTRRYEVYPGDVDSWIRGQRVETARERALRVVKARRA
jgi:hypothetical protein